MQFLDFQLALEVYRETGRIVQFIVAAASMTRSIIGPAARILRSSKPFHDAEADRSSILLLGSSC